MAGLRATHPTRSFVGRAKVALAASTRYTSPQSSQALELPLQKDGLREPAGFSDEAGPVALGHGAKGKPMQHHHHYH